MEGLKKKTLESRPIWNRAPATILAQYDYSVEGERNIFEAVFAYQVL